jgi:hypothetical protein
VPSLADLDVLRDRADEVRDARVREAVCNLLLERAHERLLARDAREVRVGVPEADEVECLLAGQLLVAGLQIDVRVVVVGRTRVLVVVATVDIQPDPTKRVDDLLEAMEVDGDQVVDREPRQVLDREQRALRVAARVGGVDPIGTEWGRRVAVDRHVEVARERQQRDRLGHWIGADQHQRVRERRVARLRAGAVVVADDERDRRAVRDRDVERARGLDDGGRVRAQSGDELVRVEIAASDPAEDQRRDAEQRDQQDAPEKPEPARCRRRRLAVTGDGADRGRRRRRWENGLAVARCLGAAPDASLQCRPHRNRYGARRAPARARIPQGPEEARTTSRGCGRATSRPRRAGARAAGRSPRSDRGRSGPPRSTSTAGDGNRGR